ncbi:MAG: hypothetical protein E7473_04260 [Ruminococcaceae bacterium]|nr:hypothetical protein [Oscillospiraceae bacterium]
MNENFSSILEKIYSTAATAGDMASKVVGDAGKKAGEVYSASKLKIKILNIKTDMDILYKEAGRLVYAEHRDEEIQRGRLQAVLLALDDKKEELDELLEALEAVKGTKKCESCGAANCRDNAFCASCGAEL